MDPVRIIILGATGDLAKKKLFRALFDLYAAGKLPEDVDVIGCARRELSGEEFAAYVQEAVGMRESEAFARVNEFISHCRYVSGDFTTPEGYVRLSALLAESRRCTHTLFYLAVSPDLYAPIFDALSTSGLAIPCVTVNGKSAWVRIAVEKPFGRDAETAMALENKLSASFAEEQIFRIDHYLAKENLENILAFRFGNRLFFDLWSHEHIESVHARLLEPFGIGSRGAFYDGFGALRDVGQNHLLQMLSLIAMRRPEAFTESAIRTAREHALSTFRFKRVVAKGQYETYAAEANIPLDSQTETYFKIEANFDMPEWEGVPFVLEAGKKMPEHQVDITISFKPSLLFPAGRNSIVFSIAPKETITIGFAAKKRGYGFSFEPRAFSFEYDDGSPDKPKEAYEKLLHDAVTGSRALFLSSSEVAYSWAFVSNVLEGWKDIPVTRYPDGSIPPEEMA